MEQPAYTLIVLIIDSDDPAYIVSRNTWRQYMNSDDRILCLFLRNDPACPSDAHIDLSSNTLTFRGTESLIPGILDKTIAAFEYCRQHFTFDYILRTNISSFYVFPLLKSHVLPTLPHSRCYAGVRGYDGTPFASGAGFFISPDIASLLVDRRSELSRVIDDIAIGRFIHSHSIPVHPLSRYDFVHDKDINNDTEKLIIAAAHNTYHFRVKNEIDRMRFDPHYMRLLLKTYYCLEVPVAE
jgi:hypothetical protein